MLPEPCGAAAGEEGRAGEGGALQDAMGRSVSAMACTSAGTACKPSPRAEYLLFGAYLETEDAITLEAERGGGAVRTPCEEERLGSGVSGREHPARQTTRSLPRARADHLAARRHVCGTRLVPSDPTQTNHA